MMDYGKDLYSGPGKDNSSRRTSKAKSAGEPKAMEEEDKETKDATKERYVKVKTEKEKVDNKDKMDIDVKAEESEEGEIAE